MKIYGYKKNKPWNNAAGNNGMLEGMSMWIEWQRQ